LILDPNNDNKLSLTPKDGQVFTFSEQILNFKGMDRHTTKQICAFTSSSTPWFPSKTKCLAGKTAIKYRLTGVLAAELQNRQKNPDKGFNRRSTTIEGVI
jgi:hypothetical protein